MSSDPYRRPAPAPPPEKPRGVVVRRADAPEDLDEETKRLRNARYKAQAIRVQAELEHGQRQGAFSGRAVGALAVLVGVVLSGATVSQLSSSGYYSPRSVAMAPAMLFIGVWYLAVGSGGSSSIKYAPTWVKIGGVVAGVLGLAWGMTGYLEFLAAFAE